MANDLRIRVLLGAIDRATAPLRRISGGSTAAAQALKAARDQVRALNAQQADVAGYRKQQAAIAGTSQKLQEAQERLRQMRTAMRASGGAASEQFRNDYRRANEAVRDLTARVQQQRRGLGPHAERLRAAGMAAGQLGQHERRLREQVEAANRALSVQQARLAAVTQRQNALARARQVHDRGQRFVGGMAAAGAAGMAGAGAPLYGAARMLAPGLDFAASMSKVQAISRLDKDSVELKALREQARELGGATMFTAGEGADAQGFLAMAGFDPNAIKMAMPGMLSLAAAGQTDLAETADIASNILSGMGLQASQMDELGDVLAGTFNRANTNLRMLGETMKYAAPMAKTYGIELTTAAAMAGKLADSGLQASMGGTALSTIMNRLASPPKAAANALDALNIKTADARGNLRDLPEILKDIHERTAGMGTATRGGILKAIAGAEAVKGMAYLVDQAGSGQLQELVSTLRQSQGEAARTAKVMGNNLKGDLTTLKSAWEDLGIELEAGQDTSLRDLAQSVTDGIRGVKTWVQENPRFAAGLVKTAAIVAGLAFGFATVTLTLAALLAPMFAVRLMLAQVGFKLPSLMAMFWRFGKVIVPFLAKALLTLFRALALNPIGLTLTAIAAAAYLIFQNWESVTDFFSSTWEELKQGFSGGIGSIVATLVNFSPIGLLYRAFAAVLTYLGVELPDRFAAFGGMLMSGLVSGIKNGLGAVKDAITSVGESSINWFKEKLGIHSPSRVFAELGGFTMEGLARGLSNGADGPLGVLAGLTRQLTWSTGQQELAPISFDRRAPVTASRSATVESRDQYQIIIQPAAGADPQAIANAVRAELVRVANEKAARRRSSLTDLE